jgi:hypothetical protein
LILPLFFSQFVSPLLIGNAYFSSLEKLHSFYHWFDNKFK